VSDLVPGNALDPTVMLATSVHAQPGVYALLLGSGVSTGAGILTGWESSRTWYGEQQPRRLPAQGPVRVGGAQGGVDALRPTRRDDSGSTGGAITLAARAAV
jgi:hypothetical protein